MFSIIRTLRIQSLRMEFSTRQVKYKLYFKLNTKTILLKTLTCLAAPCPIPGTPVLPILAHHLQILSIIHTLQFIKFHNYKIPHLQQLISTNFKLFNNQLYL